MNTFTINDISRFPKKIIALTGLDDLPAAQRKNLRENLEIALLKRIINELLSHLDEQGWADLAKSSIGLKSMTEFFQVLFRTAPNAEEIISEESEIFFDELTANA